MRWTDFSRVGRVGVRAALLTLLVTPLGGCQVVYDGVGGAFRGRPGQMSAQLSPGAQGLLNEAFSGIDPDRSADVHVHLVTADINPELVSWLHPIKRARTMVLASAAGVRIGPTLAKDYVDRLVDLVTHMPVRPKCYIYALDRCYRRDGTIDWSNQTMYVSNDLVMETAAAHPDIFVPVASINPYRTDAVQELERCAAGGCHHLKWLPNTMGIDPSDELIDPFYQRMRDLHIVLLSHTGKEHSVETVDQGLGNPLLLRRPLDLGVRVVALHAASDGFDVDLDSPARRKVPSFDLFLRLMDEPRYQGLLFGEMSAMLFFDHLDRPIKTLLQREDLQRRFVNGSDYPFAAINLATQTSVLVRKRLITRQERRYLNEIYNFNPLLFDFAVKRTIRDPQSQRKLADSIFMMPDAIR